MLRTSLDGNANRAPKSLPRAGFNFDLGNRFLSLRAFAMAEPHEFVQLPIDDTYYHAIGRVAALWSVVEAETQMLVWRLMRVSPETGQLTTAALRLNTLQAALPILAESLKWTLSVGPLGPVS